MLVYIILLYDTFCSHLQLSQVFLWQQVAAYCKTFVRSMLQVMHMVNQYITKMCLLNICYNYVWICCYNWLLVHLFCLLYCFIPGTWFLYMLCKIFKYLRISIYAMQKFSFSFSSFSFFCFLAGGLFSHIANLFLARFLLSW